MAWQVREENCEKKIGRTFWCGRPSASAVCGFTCFDSVEDCEAFFLCEDMLAFGGFTRAIRWDFDHAWDRAVWFISFCG